MATNVASEDGDDQGAPARVSPSEFMRELRPEYYSDTVERLSYVLSAPVLEYHLDSLTSRNQTHDFEIFCRKLCERTICPNLRPQTGPDGGGDSKADTETYPVSDEVSGLTYIGDVNGGRERWAFAFSAKKEWTGKVRVDVKGIAETGRKYDRIFFVTSRFAKAKDRARIEDDLSKEYGIPVTIHDRSWIVTEIIEKDRTDLAFSYLKIGEEVGARRLGPKDYSRSQQLADTERAIENPAAFHGMERQLVTEALVVAKLSRGLEKPRTETDGRFARANRLAEAHGSYRQKLEAQYEQIWTAFWWYDDFNLLNVSYDNFEARALESNHAKNLEFLGNLNQLLVNSIIHGHMAREECRFDERTARLREALEIQARDLSRPNNSLEAETDLQRIALNQAMMTQDTEALASVCRGYSAILDKAEGLGEFDADGVIRFIEVIGGVAGNDATYNELVEKLAGFVARRKSEAAGALVLLKRARKLDLSDKFDMIRWLGKAAIGLTKREHTAELIDATQLLTLAYRSAGLHWAARASCCLAAASIIIEGEKDGDLPVSIVPTMKIWAWNALELCHLPDVLFAIQLLNGCLAGLPLTEDSKEKVREDLIELDMALGCLFLNLEEDDLRRLEETPDILAGLGLFMARTALLYSLGHPEVLREDGSLPKEETDEAVNRLLSTLKGQPLAESLRGPLVLNEEGRQVFATTIMGMKVEVEVKESRHIPLAECVLGSIEAFFATVIEKRVAPHTELFRISIIASEQARDPVIEISELDMKSTVTWPDGLQLTSIDRQRDINRFYCEVAAHILGAACSVKDGTALLDELFADAAVQQRVTMIASAPNSYSRVASQNFSSLADWKEVIRRSYPLREHRVKLPRIELAHGDDERPDYGEDDGSLGVKNHKGISIRSVIDVHAWNRARWQGCGYIQIGHSQLPYMAFLFEDKAGARKIFERWRERFSTEDTSEEIGISIIRDLPDTNPHHYCVQIASNDPISRGIGTKAPVMVATRSMTMEPNDSRNLDMFLAGYERHGAFYLLPAIGRVNPEFFFDLAIMKRDLTVKSAGKVLDHEIEAMALRIRGLKTAI